jgi:hypothetical protein
MKGEICVRAAVMAYPTFGPLHISWARWVNLLIIDSFSCWLVCIGNPLVHCYVQVRVDLD